MDRRDIICTYRLRRYNIPIWLSSVAILVGCLTVFSHLLLLRFLVLALYKHCLTLYVGYYPSVLRIPRMLCWTNGWLFCSGNHRRRRHLIGSLLPGNVRQFITGVLCAIDWTGLQTDAPFPTASIWRTRSLSLSGLWSRRPQSTKAICLQWNLNKAKQPRRLWILFKLRSISCTTLVPFPVYLVISFFDMLCAQWIISLSCRLLLPFLFGQRSSFSPSPWSL